MLEYTLEKIAGIVKGELIGDKAPVVTYLETDSRKAIISDKSLFIAIKGERHNGHRYIKELHIKGIRHFMVEKGFEGIEKFDGANFIVVDNNIKALQDIAKNHRKGFNFPIISITGSNGKTVVKEWLFQCLSKFKSVTRSPKSYNSQVGVPLSIWLMDIRADIGIVEAGISQPGEMECLEEIIKPQWGIITNIGPPHQANFDSPEHKIKEKLTLFKNAETIFYCSDYEAINKELRKHFADKELVSWSHTNPDSFLYVEDIKKHSKYTNVQVLANKEKQEITVPFTDEASLENCMHIMTVLTYMSLPFSKIQEALTGLSPVEMRLEQVKGIWDTTIINDTYNSDLNSLRIALDYLSTQKQHQQLIVILSDIQQAGIDKQGLYKKVNDLLSVHNISWLFAIGTEIASYGEFTPVTKYFHSTSEFLSSIQRADLEGSSILVKGSREFEFERIVNALSAKKHITTLEINMAHAIYNLNYFRSFLNEGTKMMVMVKALGYGSGVYELANMLEHQKVDYLGVAYSDEGVALRKAGIKLPIMVMSPFQDSHRNIVQYGLEPEVFNMKGLLSVVETMEYFEEKANMPVHLKLDTGMHRLGFMPNEIEDCIEVLKKHPRVCVKSVFSHLSVADDASEDAFTERQIELFDKMYKAISKGLGYRPMRHILNSAGIERFPKAQYEMVRLGIGLHGISAAGKHLMQVSQLKTQISQIKYIPQGDSIGYNRRGRAETDMKIGIIPVGYADGFSRKFGGRVGNVVVNGRQAPVIGDICMDMTMVDLTGIDAHEGDRVVVFGEENPISELANKIGTIPYEILTSVSSRVKRVYYNEPS